jgi:NAD(P)-dependent dehydrogenase (short-subunit alcohol dehydrogenase family)
MLKIKDSGAVITGGRGKIGMALARYWKAGGGRVVLADVVETDLEKAREELGPETVTVVCDVTRVFLSVRECLERMVNHGCRGLICLISSTSTADCDWGPGGS